MKIIYFDQDCEENAEEYTAVNRFNKKAEKFSNCLDQAAIIACSIAIGVAIAVMFFVLI